MRRKRVVFAIVTGLGAVFGALLNVEKLGNKARVYCGATSINDCIAAGASKVFQTDRCEAQLSPAIVHRHAVMAAKLTEPSLKQKRTAELVQQNRKLIAAYTSMQNSPGADPAFVVRTDLISTADLLRRFGSDATILRTIAETEVVLGCKFTLVKPA